MWRCGLGLAVKASGGKLSRIEGCCVGSCYTAGNCMTILCHWALPDPLTGSRQLCKNKISCKHPADKVRKEIIRAFSDRGRLRVDGNPGHRGSMAPDNLGNSMTSASHCLAPLPRPTWPTLWLLLLSSCMMLSTHISSDVHQYIALIGVAGSDSAPIW